MPLGRSTQKLLLRALVLSTGQAALQTGLLVALGSALEIPLVSVNALLLVLAISALGAVWALRQRLADLRSPRAPSSFGPSLSAAYVPLVACAAFVAPRIVLGPTEPALATLAVIALVAPVAERAWARLVFAAAPAPAAARCALCAAASLTGVGLAAAAAGASAPSTLVSLLCAAALGTFVGARVRRLEREERAIASWVDGFEVRADAVTCPESPSVRDARLRALASSLRTRAEQLAVDATVDSRAREQITDARELRTRFMAAMGHELRSPLNSVVGFAQLLESGLDGELAPGQRESVTMIRRSAEELILLMTDVLDLARLEAGKLELRASWTPSVEILTEAVRLARTIVEGREVVIEAELQPGLPPVWVDQRRIVQAVVALFRHAASSLAKTTVRLRARIAYGPPGPDRHLRVEIYDALGAIPQEDVDRIFEAFQEITTPSGRRVGGLGMALTLSRGLVRLHGGDVWADSFPGAGTILCVAIPLEAISGRASPS